MAKSTGNCAVQHCPATGQIAKLPVTETGEATAVGVYHPARRAIEQAVSQVFGVEPRALNGGSRGKREIAHARQVAMYLAHVSCGWTLTDVGSLFERDRTTVAHACQRIEYDRDDPQFDRALDLLGWAVPVMISRPQSGGNDGGVQGGITHFAGDTDPTARLPAADLD